MKSQIHVCTIASTRPELIRLSRIIAKLDECCNHTLIYTGQNYDPKLSTIFFEELGIRPPNVTIPHLGDEFGTNLGNIFNYVERELKYFKPDKVLILGDTNGGLSAIIAKKLHIPIYHMEAGNRCGEWINEEINRHLIDSISDIHLPYTNRSRDNLIAQGVDPKKIFVIGNPIKEVISCYTSSVSLGTTQRYKLTSGNYFLATFHRNENVTDEGVLKHIIHGLNELYKMYNIPIICSVHPKTRINLDKFGIVAPEGITFLEPMGFQDWMTLQRNAKCIITDSGTIPEEATILRVPSVIIRNHTERPELIECGSTILCGTKSVDIVNSVSLMLNNSVNWVIPQEYTIQDVSDRVVKLLLGRI